jgi:hypothetical protein
MKDKWRDDARKRRKSRVSDLSSEYASCDKVPDSLIIRNSLVPESKECEKDESGEGNDEPRDLVLHQIVLGNKNQWVFAHCKPVGVDVCPTIVYPHTIIDGIEYENVYCEAEGAKYHD